MAEPTGIEVTTPVRPIQLAQAAILDLLPEPGQGRSVAGGEESPGNGIEVIGPPQPVEVLVPEEPAQGRGASATHYGAQGGR